jgi:hypothetical protein
MTRTGKIARLPREIRDQLNRRLQNGEPATKLATWLNSLPKAKAVLKTDFNNQPISPQNLSEWKAGGYRDWLLQQQTIDMVRRMQADSDELSRAAKTRVTDLLAQRLVARYVLAAQRLNESTGDGAADLKLLRELCADIVALRKGDHSAERLKIEHDRIDFERELDSRDLKKLFWEWAQDHEEEICTKAKTRAENIERIGRRLFGRLPGDPSPPAKPQVATTESNQIKPDQTKSNQEILQPVPTAPSRSCCSGGL